MSKWTTQRLGTIADIRVSNVDKKFYSTETPVQLCNYMDVYSNEYVTDSLDFMQASASKAEIGRFSLQRGDVVITKDSETPDDIGIPTVIANSINNLVCGYHLCLIRPDNSKLNPIFLSKQLSTSDVRRYFAVNATGSTRFGLSIGAIEKIEIPTPPISEQTKIAEILSTVDKAIEQTEELIAKQQRIKTGLMQDLLTKGIDENGCIRSEQTHKFKDSPLGRIPAEWEVKQVEQAVEFLDRKRVPLKQGDRNQIDGEYPYYGASGIIDFIDKYLFDEKLILVGEDGENVVSRNLPLVFQVSGKIWVNNHAHVLKPRDDYDIDFLTERLEFYDYTLLISGSAQPKLNQRNLRLLNLPMPPKAEQIRIGNILNAQNDLMKNYFDNLNKLRSLKTGLMQDLLTGGVRVTPLLNRESEAS